MNERIILSNKLFKASRLRSLFSNFDHLKEANPDGYEANLQAWKQVIDEILEHQKLVYLDSSQLIDEFSVTSTVNNSSVVLKPLSLDTVLNDMVNDETSVKLIPESVFSTRPSSIYDHGLLNNISIKNGLIWAISKAGLYDPKFNITANSNKQGNFLIKTRLVSVKKLEEYEKRVIEAVKQYNKSKQQDLAKNLFTKESLFELLHENLGINARDFDLLLVYLERDSKDILIGSGIIKFKESEKDTISSSDIAVAQLNTAIASTVEKSETLTKKIDSYSSKIKELLQVKSTNREYLKLLLRIRKSFEKSLVSVGTNLSNLEELLVNIMTQKDNIEVVGVLGESKDILKDLNKQLDSSQVVELMDDIKEDYEKISEVNETLSELSNLDEEQIDEELVELEKQEKEKEKIEKEKQEKEKQEKEKHEKEKQEKEKQEKEKQEKEKQETAKLPATDALANSSKNLASQNPTDAEPEKATALLDKNDAEEDELLLRLQKLKVPSKIKEKEKEKSTLPALSS